MCSFLLKINVTAHSVFTLPDTETDKDICCIELCGSIHIAEIDATQIPVGFCDNLSVSDSVHHNQCQKGLVFRK